jgi:hypothetical protein
MSAVSNGISGGVTNSGMYAMTTPQSDFKWNEFIGAGVGGTLSGALGSQSGYLARPLDGLPSHLVQYGVSTGGSLAGGAVDSAISGDEYGIYEMAFDGAAGAAQSHFPGAAELGSNPGWMTHGFSAYGGAHVGAIVESVKFVGGELIDRGTGAAPW